MRATNLAIAVTATFAVAVLAAPRSARALESNRTDMMMIQLKAGLHSPGEVYFWDYDVYGSYDVGLDLSASIDLGLTESFSIGTHLDLIFLGGEYDNGMLSDLGLDLRLCVAGSDVVLWRPVFGVGVAYSTTSLRALTLRGGIEVVIGVRETTGIVIEALAYGSPVGGIDESWLSFGPTALLRVGVAFDV